MLSLVDRLQAQVKLLREALARLDWEAVALLDKQSRILVKTVAASESWDDRELHQGISELSQIYAELQQAGRAERDRLAGELTRLSQSKQVNQAYKPLG
ncbi:flagellar protein FliT [Stutzerimonas zhaodongensis]|jgi:hypothetical protein|uniref:Flagellar protein FliT n=1 Tax=Stutzerimonas zhaodongensis TaxID=1176257 RepID=A0A365PRW9_9GAMM|nr:flagellar protein FliT [Stutzerimonas zhaodongensis]QWV16233.1 flagellar protein FliT [Stutzerimonas zhaodongensis]RBA55254.1 flagellar protein FliT [Stutzerimonas zhaodongensis]